MIAPPQKRVFGLRTIAVFEAAKGLLAAAAGFGMISLRHTDLHAVAVAFLLRHRIDPDRHYSRLFIDGLAKATNYSVSEIAAFAFAYAALRIVEGYGLWHGKHWAEWFAVISAGIYLPLEIQHLIRHTGPLNAGIFALNIVIIVFLAGSLRREHRRKQS